MQCRNIIIFLFTLLVFLFNADIVLGVGNQAIPENGSSPETRGKAVVLMDACSGRVLYENNCHEQLPPASLTKIMTGLLVAEKGNMNKKVKVSEHAASTPECSIYLETGETLSRMELLYAAMLNSANDASVALAESVAGSEADFVQLMNQRAGELGLKNTHYANPHGLEDEGHYSSAYDLACLSRQALSNKVFAEVVGTEQKRIPWEGHDDDRVLSNMNRLLYRYDGTIGVKTGYTHEAGNCVVGAAQKGDMTLIAVSMNSPSVYEDLQNMLDYGFETYQMFTLKKSDQFSTKVKVIEGESESFILKPVHDLRIAVTPAEIPYLTYSIVAPAQLEAPVQKGSVLGVCNLCINGEKIAAIDLLAAQAVKKIVPPGHLAKTGQIILFCITRWYLYLIGLILALLFYKRKENISWEECMRRILLRLLSKQIARRRRKKR